MNEMNRFRLDGKVAIVTLGTAGIGRAIALGMAEAGADIVLLGRSQNPTETCNAIRSPGRQALAFQGDICERQFAERVVSESLAHWGRLDRIGTTSRPLRAFLRGAGRRLQLPTGLRQVSDIRVGKEKILIHDHEGEVVAQLSVPAHV
jgi:NAD(P)-dependent dehydrogenase (short-subunit alcohol dehydrogenase family)